MILEEKLLKKLTELRYNNNQMVKELKTLELETIETERRLMEVEKNSKDLLEFYSQMSGALLEISSQLNYLKECSKKKQTGQGQSKSRNTKNQNKNKKISALKKIENLSLSEQSEKYKQIITFLFNEFLKSKNPDDIADEEIEDENQSLDSQEE